MTVLPNWRDRMAHSRQAMTNKAPLLYRNEVDTNRLRWRSKQMAHVYIDISGSMGPFLPWLAGAVEPLNRRGLCRLYAFSTIVAAVRRGGLLTDPIPNTGGTDIRCVFEHFLALPQKDRPRKVVVLTDGCTGKPDQEQAKDARRKQVQLWVGVIGDGNAEDLREYAHEISIMPPLK